MNLLTDIRWGRLVLVFFILLLVQTALNFAWVGVYSHLIDPGGDEAYYRNYIFRNRFWVNLVICLPLYFLAARWLGRKAGAHPMIQAMALFGLHLIFDTVSELTMGDLAGYVGGYLLFNLVVLAAAYFGGKQAEKALNPVSN